MTATSALTQGSVSLKASETRVILVSPLQYHHLRKEAMRYEGSAPGRRRAVLIQPHRDVKEAGNSGHLRVCSATTGTARA